MKDYHLTIYGKEFSKETKLAKAFFAEHAIEFTSIDIEGDKFYTEMIKAHKITGIPIIRLIKQDREYQYIGCGATACKKLLSIISK